MLEARGLSQRALASEIAVSEGTIRNALLYAEAADLRDGYAPTAVHRAQLSLGGEPLSAEQEIAALSVRQVRPVHRAARRRARLLAGPWRGLKALTKRRCPRPRVLSAGGERLLRLVVRTLAQSDAIAETTIAGRPTREVLEERLRVLPWPELVLLAALALGDGKDPGSVLEACARGQPGLERAESQLT